MDQTTPLIGVVGHQGHLQRLSTALEILHFFTLKSALAFLFTLALTGFQSFCLPSLLEGLERWENVPGILEFWIGYYWAPTILDSVTRGSWTLITVDLGAHFHRLLLGVKLTSIQRDALRKCDSSDTTIRIFATKIPVTIASLVLIFKGDLGTPLALLLSVALAFANVLSRLLPHQHKATKEDWRLSVQRSNSLYVSQGGVATFGD